MQTLVYSRRSHYLNKISKLPCLLRKKECLKSLLNSTREAPRRQIQRPSAKCSRKTTSWWTPLPRRTTEIACKTPSSKTAKQQLLLNNHGLLTYPLFKKLFLDSRINYTETWSTWHVWHIQISLCQRSRIYYRFGLINNNFWWSEFLEQNSVKNSLIVAHLFIVLNLNSLQKLRTS